MLRGGDCPYGRLKCRRFSVFLHVVAYVSGKFWLVLREKDGLVCMSFAVVEGLCALAFTCPSLINNVYENPWSWAVFGTEKIYEILGQ